LPHILLLLLLLFLVYENSFQLVKWFWDLYGKPPARVERRGECTSLWWHATSELQQQEQQRLLQLYLPLRGT